MKRGDRIIIEQCANGFIVRSDAAREFMSMIAEPPIVFNFLGRAVADQPIPDLLRFIEDHFGATK